MSVEDYVHHNRLYLGKGSLPHLQSEILNVAIDKTVFDAMDTHGVELTGSLVVAHSLCTVATCTILYCTLIV